jgi:NAD(P)-dependent dehydrogenase (short-subunit alcohol dehydrogenase family)
MTPALQKVALVTGAARGIGLAVAKRFLAEGWRVALLDIEGELLHGAVAALANPGAAMALHCDVSDSGAVTAAMAKLGTSFGRLDALVNNAGIAVFAPLMETSDADWSRVLEVNLTGPFLCTKAAVPLMREHGGAIVNITSISAVRASTLRSAYGTSKAGLAHLTKQFAVELASLGIRVNGVTPGPVETAMAKAVHTPKSAPTITTRSPSTATASKKSWRRRCTSCAATARATSPDRFSRSTAASTPPASDCRRCAASDGIRKRAKAHPRRGHLPRSGK